MFPGATEQAQAWADMAQRVFAGTPEAASTVTDRVMESQAQALRWMQEMTERWTGMAEDAVRGETAAAADPLAAFQQMASIFKSAPFMDFLSSPGFGLMREAQLDVGGFLSAASDYAQHEIEYRVLVGQTWAKAQQAMMTRLTTLTAAGDAPRDPKKLMKLWVEVADEVFVEAFRSPAFVEAQSNLVNAGHRMRAARRTLTEDGLAAQDLPTKTEVEAAHRAIYLLRKEVKALRRDLAALRPEGGTP